MERRVARLEKDMEVLCSDVRNIMRNHLPHIKEELVAIKAQMRIWSWLMGVILAGVIGLVLKAFI